MTPANDNSATVRDEQARKALAEFAASIVTFETCGPPDMRYGAHHVDADPPVARAYGPTPEAAIADYIENYSEE